MLTINLARGKWDVIEGHRVRGVRLNDVAELPMTQYAFSRDAYLKGLPRIADAYDLLMEHNFPPEAVLGKLIEKYLPFRVFRVKQFARMPLCVGFIGKRGAGKTVGAVGVATLDWLIRGEPVWSNVDIEVRIVYKDLDRTFRSIPLDKLDLLDMSEGYQSGLVIVDEVNMEAGEATRYMSGANLQFANILQQIRKRRLSVLWSCQGWGWVDARLRWQSDLVVNCADAFLKGAYRTRGLGEKSIWTVYDLSGLTGQIDGTFESRWLTEYEVWSGAFYNRAFWSAYNTEKLQGGSDYIADFKLQKGLEKDQRHYEIAQQRQQPAEDYARALFESGGTYLAADIWEKNGIGNDRGRQTAIGKAMQRYFIKRRDGDGQYYYKPKTDLGVVS